MRNIFPWAGKRNQTKSINSTFTRYLRFYRMITGAIPSGPQRAPVCGQWSRRLQAGVDSANASISTFRRRGIVFSRVLAVRSRSGLLGLFTVSHLFRAQSPRSRIVVSTDAKRSLAACNSHGSAFVPGIHRFGAANGRAVTVPLSVWADGGSGSTSGIYRFGARLFAAPTRRVSSGAFVESMMFCRRKHYFAFEWVLMRGAAIWKSSTSASEKLLLNQRDSLLLVAHNPRSTIRPALQLRMELTQFPVCSLRNSP